MPASSPSAAFFIAALMSSTVVSFFSSTVRSTTETVGVGTRIAKPVKTPLSSGITSEDSLRGTGGGDDVLGRSTRAAQILVPLIQRDLVIGVGVDRRHQSPGNAEVVLQDLGHGGQAVGGARGVGDDVMVGGIVVLLVHTNHDGDVLTLRRSGDDDLLGACLEVLASALAVTEDARRLNDDVDTQLGPEAPRDCGWRRP